MPVESKRRWSRTSLTRRPRSQRLSSEVRNAALPGVAQAVRAEFGDSLTVPQAVLLIAIKRGELWLPFNPARGGISKKIQKP